MSLDLKHVLDFESNNPQRTIITSSNADATFVFHYLLSACIQQEACGVVLINFSHTMSHYRAVQKKLGYSSALEKKGDLFFNVNSMNIGKSIMESGNATSSILDHLVQDVEKALSSSSSSRLANSPKVYVLIDDLSMLQLLGIRDKLVIRMLERIARMHANVHIVLHMQTFDCNRLLVNDLCYTADLLIQIHNISTGYSKEFDGSMKINHNKLIRPTTFKTYLFKTNEKNVNVYAIN